MRQLPTVTLGLLRHWASRVLLLGTLFIVSQLGVQAQTPPDFVALKEAWWAEHSLMPVSLPAQLPHHLPMEASLSPAQNGNFWGMVFQQSEAGNWDIYLKEDTQVKKRITEHPAADVYPRLTIGGTRIAFASNRDDNFEIYTMGLEGENLTRLTFDGALDTMPVWAPDGKQLIFVSERRGNADLYRINADGSGLTLLTENAVPDLHPHWSPDGSRVVWVQQNGSRGTLWVMNTDGSGAHPISGPHRFAARPVWSPDGSRIAFDADFDGDGLNQLGVINADGSDLRILTSRRTADEHWMGSWDVLGYHLAFTIIEWETNQETREIYIHSAHIQRYCMIEGEICGSYEDGPFAFNPDMQSLDVLPPQSYLQPLAPYSRRENLVLRGEIVDQGRSGVAGYRIQYRQGNEGAWTNVDLWFDSFNAPSVDLSIPLPELPIDEYFFRVTGVDYAGNQEAWPADERGQASTKLFTSLLAGRLTDTRGRPLVKYPVSIAPAPWEPPVTDHNGEFQLHLRFADLHTFQNSIQFLSNRDRYFSDYLIPSGNLIQNHDFEEANSRAWQLSGAAQLINEPSLAHSGNHSLSLGRHCMSGCLVELPLPTEYLPAWHHTQLYSDAQGNLHFLAQHITTLVHQVRTVDGFWQPYTILSNNSSLYTSDLAIGADGAIHIVWSEPSGTQQEGDLYHAWRTPAGEWHTPVVVGRGIEPQITVDGNGTLHVISRWKEGANAEPIELSYWRRTTTGTWSKQEVIATANPLYGYDLVTLGNTLHVIWGGHSAESNLSEVLHRQRDPRGQWSSPVQIRSGPYPASGLTPYTNLNLQVDGRNRLHLFWLDNQDSNVPQYYYRLWQAGSGWSTLESIPLGTEYSRPNQVWLFINQADQPMLLAGAVEIHTRTPQGVWTRSSIPVANNLQARETVQLHLTKPGELFVVGYSPATFTYHLYQSQPKPEPVLGQVAQRVTVPASMHRPTLAFLHNLVGELNATNGLTVTVTDALTTTLVYRHHQESFWGLGWADLSLWRGQTITVTFSFASAADLFSGATLDKVSLTSWRTPAVTSIDPQRIQSGVATKVRIAGENFLGQPTVMLDNQVLNDVRRLSENELEVDLPAMLRPGMYDLWITNPGERSATYAGALAIGDQRYLPFVSAP